MKIRKTRKSERTTYTYYFDNGDKIILEPGKQTTIRASGYVSVKVDDSITELAIAQMHKDDDKEVESNLNYINCETRADAEKRRKLKKEWDEDHRDEFGFVHGENPYEKPRRLESLDAFHGEDDFDEDKSKILYDIATQQERDNEDPYIEIREAVRSFVSTLPDSMKELYRLLYIEEYKPVEAAKILGIKDGTLSERKKLLKEKIKKYLKDNPNFSHFFTD